jgi:hypothetical protein
VSSNEVSVTTALTLPTKASVGTVQPVSITKATAAAATNLFTLAPLSILEKTVALGSISLG